MYFYYLKKATGPSTLTEDYVHCDMCNRKYNESAYQKHLAHCERKTKEILMKNRGNAPSSQMGSRGNTTRGGISGNSGIMKNNMNGRFGKK